MIVYVYAIMRIGLAACIIFMSGDVPYPNGCLFFYVLYLVIDV